MMKRLGLASLLVLLAAAPASAHVIVDTSDRHPGAANVSMAVLVQSEYPDGSLSGTGPGSPTVRIVLHLPASVTGITPVALQGWTTAVTGSTVTWSGGSLASGRSAVFDLDVAKLPAQASLTTPVEQSYADGREVDWHGPVGDAHPAPVLALDGSTGNGGITSITNGSVSSGATRSTGSHGSSLGLILGGGGVAVLLVGGALLVRRRRTAGATSAAGPRDHAEVGVKRLP